MAAKAVIIVFITIAIFALVPLAEAVRAPRGDERVFRDQRKPPHIAFGSASSTRLGTRGRCNNTALDVSGLMGFFSATNGPHWRNNEGWGNTSRRLDEWAFVKCENGNVVELTTRRNRLSGSISDALVALSALPYLAVVDLQNDGLCGTLPVEFFTRAKRLRVLILDTQVRSLHFRVNLLL